MSNIHFQSTAIISSDVPDMIADSYRLYHALLYSEKPIVTGTFRVEGFKPMKDMLVAVRGSENALAEKPLAIFDACPSPPLKWSNLTTQSLIDCARAGIPSELISMGMTGATSPVTIAGTLVQHVAENFCGIVICQLANKGAPVVFGGSPSSFDMRKGTTPMGAIETMMIDSAYTQIAKHLGLPSHVYLGLSDSKIIDRDTYDYWFSLGKKTMAERVNEEVEKLLSDNPPDIVDSSIKEDLRSIMLTDAKNYGLATLPEKGLP
jgi:trimethylamine--corrinoid protein Co-methyltransferase